MSLSFLLRRAFQVKTQHANTLAPALERLRIPSNTFVKLRYLSTEVAPAKEAPEEGKPKEDVDPTKVRGRFVEKVPVETSIRYLQSRAYSITYGSDPVWKNYRRNFKGAIPPKKTRKKCIRQGKIATGSPCPICRDDYLVLSPDNVDLLKQFISPHSGEIISYKKTGICQQRYKELLSAVDIAKDRGSITFDVPFRPYDYSEFKK